MQDYSQQIFNIQANSHPSANYGNGEAVQYKGNQNAAQATPAKMYSSIPLLTPSPPTDNELFAQFGMPRAMKDQVTSYPTPYGNSPLTPPFNETAGRHLNTNQYYYTPQQPNYEIQAAMYDQSVFGSPVRPSSIGNSQLGSSPMPSKHSKGNYRGYPAQQYTGSPYARQQSGTMNTEKIWPFDVEQAFLEALKKIPKLGRRKVNVNGKACGRNELIADYIWRRTGKYRTRKQVSSHIQVLKHMKANDKEFMELLSEPSHGDMLMVNSDSLILVPKNQNEQFTRMPERDNILKSKPSADQENQLETEAAAVQEVDNLTNWNPSESAKGQLFPDAFFNTEQDFLFS